MFRLNKNSIILILILLSFNLLAGLLSFKQYGMSWDEPLFYDYADSIRFAYSPQAFSPNFDFYLVFGKSPEDHKIYGPAYLLLARPVQQIIMSTGQVDPASAWHLTNFLSFQFGLFIFFLLALRWLEPASAAAATAFFAWQPVFWGHAFINPKDIPFMVFFLLALTLGLEFVDHLNRKPEKRTWVLMALAALGLGLASATRVIGPLAGVIVFIYFLLQKKWHSVFIFILYALTAILTMFFFWPYLWADPINNLLSVLKHMSNNPTELAVLFNGQIFRANLMPRSYLPKMFLLTLTEPAWLLFVFGSMIAFRKMITKKLDWRGPTVVFALFAFMLAYLLINNPAVYDGFRHFFFITPPVFLMIGFSLQWLRNRLKPYLWVAILILILAPGLLNIIKLRPYEYTYYNSFTAGVGGAYRTYETDYWLTCYKESLEWVKNNHPNTTLHIQREFPLAQYYASGLTIKDLTTETDADIQTGDLMLFHTRADLDIRSIYRKLPIIHEIGRDSAQYCIIKQKD